MQKGGEVRRFLKSSSIFFIGSTLSKTISFFLIPLYTAYISPEGMGYYDIALTYISVIIPVVFLEIWSAIIRFLFDAKSDKEKGTIISSSWRVFFISAALYLIGAFVFFLFVKTKYSIEIFILGLMLAFASVYQFASRGLGMDRQFAVSGVLNTVTLSISNIFLIVVMGWDERSLIVSLILGYMVQVLFLERKTGLFKMLSYSRSDTLTAKSMVKYSFPLSLNSVSFWVLKSSSKIVILYKMSLVANGIFSISQRFANIIAMLTTVFSFAWQEVTFSRKNKKDGVFYSKALNAYWVALLGGTALILPALKIIIPFFIKGEYTEAINLVPLGMVAAALSGYATFMGNIFGALKDTKYILYSTMISGLLNIVLSIGLIIPFGLQGINFAMIVSWVLNIFIRYIVLGRKVGLQINKMLFLAVVFLASLSCYFFINLNSLSNFIFFMMLLSLIVVYLVSKYLREGKFWR